MKNCYLFFIFSLVFISNTFSQNPTPNAGFENWVQTGNHFDPINWNTLNPATSVVGVLTATRATGADVHTGSYAIKLTTKSVFNLTANGIASTGTIITTPPYGVIGGIPFAGRPDSIAGWYKCSPQPGDTGFAQILLIGGLGDTVGFVRWWAPPVTVSTFTRFSKAITYYSSNAVDTAQWILSSSKGFNQIVNSSIIFDDIALITNPVGLPDYKEDKTITLYPAVSSGLFTLQNTGRKKLLVLFYNNHGQLIAEYKISESLNSINLVSKPKGIYLYQVLDDKNKLMVAGKIVNN